MADNTLGCGRTQSTVGTAVPARGFGGDSDALLRAATARRAKLKGLFVVGPLNRLTQHICADLFQVAGTCRPTRLVRYAISAMRRPDAASGTLPLHGRAKTCAQTDPSSVAARLSAGVLAVGALLGAAIGVAVDAIVLLVVSALALPAVLVHAVRAAKAPQDVRIDSRRLRRDDLAHFFNATIGHEVPHFVLKQNEPTGVAQQFPIDVPRQKMYIMTKSNPQARRLSRDPLQALAEIKPLCTDDAGILDKAFLWAVTDMSTQSLFNAVFSKMVDKSVVTYRGQNCLANFNGDSTLEIEQLSASALAVRGEMNRRQGIEVGIMDGPYAGVHSVPTPMRLKVAVVIHKGSKNCPMPRVAVTEVSLKAF